MRELCPWFALTVKHQHEQAVQAALKFKGYEAMAPTYRTRRAWSDRIQEIDLPLFAGYVFCRFPFEEKLKIVNTPGVAKVVGFGGHPVEIPDLEISAVRAVMSSRLPARPWPHLKPGDRVCIERGPLRGVEGTLLRERSGNDAALHLVIGVELLQRSIAVELEPDMITPLPAFAGGARRLLECGI